MQALYLLTYPSIGCAKKKDAPQAGQRISAMRLAREV